MATEIERKFLVQGTPWTSLTGIEMIQGYLHATAEWALRIRIAGETAWLTFKGASADGMSRPEFEYPLPVADAREMLELWGGALVHKTRYRIPHEGHTWEVDVFHGENDGLVLAEVELRSTDEDVTLPPWSGTEVTGLERYYNAYLAAHPYQTWSP